MQLQLISNGNSIGFLEIGEIPLTYSIQEIRDITKRKGSFSKSFNVPRTKENNILLDQAYNINKSLSIYSLKGRVIQDNAVIFEGFVKLKKSANQYQLNLLGDNMDWAQQLKDISLKDLSYGNPFQSYTSSTGQSVSVQATTSAHVFDREYIEASWARYYDDNWDYTYLVVGYGQWSKRNAVDVSDVRPAIFYKGIIEKAFAQIGYCIESDFLNLEMWNRLVMPYTGNFSISQNSREQLSAQIENQTTDIYTENRTGFVAGIYGFPFNFEIENSDPSGINSIQSVNFINPNGGTTNYNANVITITESGKYRLTGNFNFKTRSASNVIGLDFQIALFDTSGNFINPIQTNLTVPPVGTTNDFSIDTFEFDLTPGTYCIGIAFTINQILLPSGWWDFEIQTGLINIERTTDVIVGSEYTVSDTLPDISAFDILRGLQNIFNLYYYTDVAKRVVYIEPGETFFKGNSNAINWTDKIDSYEIDYLDNYNRNLIFAYAEDSTDGYQEEINKQNEFLAGSLEYEIPEDETFYKDGDQKIGTPIQSYTLYYEDDLITDDSPIKLPRLWQDFRQFPDYTNDFNIRIGFKTYQRPDNLSEWLWQYNATQNVDVERLPTMSEEYNGNSLNYNTENGLVNTYYRREIASIADGRVLKCNAYLLASDLVKLDFRNPIYLDIPNIKGYYRINQIKDYKPNTLTQIELIKVVNPCIDLDASGYVDAEIEDTSGLGKGSNSSGKTNLNPSTVLQNGSGNQAPINAGSVAFGNGVDIGGEKQHGFGNNPTIGDDDIFVVGTGTPTEPQRGLTIGEGFIYPFGGKIYDSNGLPIVAEKPDGNLEEIYLNG